MPHKSYPTKRQPSSRKKNCAPELAGPELTASPRAGPNHNDPCGPFSSPPPSISPFDFWPTEEVAAAQRPNPNEPQKSAPHASRLCVNWARDLRQPHLYNASPTNHEAQSPATLNPNLPKALPGFAWHGRTRLSSTNSAFVTLCSSRLTHQDVFIQRIIVQGSLPDCITTIPFPVGSPSAEGRAPKRHPTTPHRKGETKTAPHAFGKNMSVPPRIRPLPHFEMPPRFLDVFLFPLVWATERVQMHTPHPSRRPRNPAPPHFAKRRLFLSTSSLKACSNALGKAAHLRKVRTQNPPNVQNRHQHLSFRKNNGGSGLRVFCVFCGRWTEPLDGERAAPPPVGQKSPARTALFPHAKPTGVRADPSEPPPHSRLLRRVQRFEFLTRRSKMTLDPTSGAEETLVFLRRSGRAAQTDKRASRHHCDNHNESSVCHLARVCDNFAHRSLASQLFCGRWTANPGVHGPQRRLSGRRRQFRPPPPSRPPGFDKTSFFRRGSFRAISNKGVDRLPTRCDTPTAQRRMLAPPEHNHEKKGYCF